MGSELENDAGTMTDYTSINLDRDEYPFKVFHYPLTSIGPKLRETLLAPFSGVRRQPTTTPMYATDSTTSDGATVSPLPPVSPLNWTFKKDDKKDSSSKSE